LPFVNNGAVKIHYEVVGHGPTVVLHTGAGGDSRMWRDAGYLKGLADFRLILMDQRGRGLSSRPAALEEHRMDRFVADVNCVLDDVGVDAVGFWGYSNGAMVGIAFGADHSTRLKGLVGTGSFYSGDLTDLPPISNVEAEIQRLVAQGGVVHELEAFMANTGEQFPDPIDRNVRETDPRMYALDEVAWVSWRGPRSAYPTFPAPVLAIGGEREDKNRHTERSMAMLPKGQIIRLEGLGHLGAFYRSDLALPHARPFLEQTLGRG
jgi:pimeloyl-ACP methyl ester carboxylesterase